MGHRLMKKQENIEAGQKNGKIEPETTPKEIMRKNLQYDICHLV